MKVLNLYAGLGGNRKHWKDVEVTAIELEPEIAEVYAGFYPNDKLILTDAHQYLMDHSDEFDFIWSSPPCQTHSRMMKATRHTQRRYTDMSLYQEIIFLQNFFTGKWVVENVTPFYDPLIKPTSIIGRHYFWSNFKISGYDADSIEGFITKDNVAGANEIKKWLGMEYEGNIYYKDNHSPGQVWRNCVHPDLGLHIFNCMKGKLERENIRQNTLFTQL